MNPEIGTQLYHDFMNWAADKLDDSGRELQQKVWIDTPWIINAATGHHNDLMPEIRDWCRARFGEEAWPIHGKPGNWQVGGATINGYTWFGFGSKEMMADFADEWVTDGLPSA